MHLLSLRRVAHARLVTLSILAALTLLAPAVALTGTASAAPNLPSAAYLRTIDKTLPKHTINVPPSKQRKSAPIAHAAMYACGTFFAVITNMGPTVAPQTKYCFSPGDGYPGNYLHLGNAQWWFAYYLNWCGQPQCTPSELARSQLGMTGHNIYAVPTNGIDRESNTSLWTTVYWVIPDNHTYCYFNSRISGADGSMWASSQLQWGCGPYTPY